MTPSRWVDDANAALLTDLYELTMLQAYWKEKMTEEAVFSLFTRKLPSNRNYLITAGLDDVLHFLENCTFPQDYLDYLNTQGLFSEDFLDRLSRFRFEGDVYAMPEGTPFFADEPVLEVVAPIFQAQLVETFAMNQIHFQSVLASKASRVAFAARGGNVVDFGLRRMSGTDAGLKSARAFHIAGVNATSNVLAGYVYGAAITGTMAHSYIQAHDTEMDAFRAFARLYPSTVLLVDTYDTLEGVRKVVRLAEELGEGFTVRGIRLDSGDLAELAVQSREILDAAGLTEVSIFVSGSLDEFAIAEIVAKDVPVSGFGVGTKMGVSEDNPSLDMAYKLTAYAGKGRLKTSSGKRILPGKKQVFRVEEHGRAAYDILAGEEESHPGRPLLRKVMERGKRLPDGRVGLDESRDLCRKELEAMPERIRAIAPAEPPYEVRISPELKRKQSEVIARVESESA